MARLYRRSVDKGVAVGSSVQKSHVTAFSCVRSSGLLPLSSTSVFQSQYFARRVLSWATRGPLSWRLLPFTQRAENKRSPDIRASQALREPTLWKGNEDVVMLG